ILARATGRIFDYDTYMRMRYNTIGMKAFFVLAEYGLGPDLSEEMAHKDMRDIHSIALEHISVVNDLFSFRKEYYAKEYINSICILCDQERLDLQGAVYKASGIIHAKESAFLDKRGEILSGKLGARPGVRAYLDELGYTLAGNLQWSYLTPRYHGAGHT